MKFQHLIVGGMPRDIILCPQLKPNDMDVLFPYGVDIPPVVLKLMGVSAMMAYRQKYGAPPKGGGSVSKGQTSQVFDIIDVQRASDPFEHMAMYSVNLCKIAYTGSEFFISEEFERDRRDKAITFCPSETWDEGEMSAHLGKMVEKFPGYTLRRGEGHTFTPANFRILKRRNGEPWPGVEFLPKAASRKLIDNNSMFW